MYLLKFILCLISIQFLSLKAFAQFTTGDTVLIGTGRAPIYYIYEINGNFFSLDDYGKQFLIRRKHLTNGKQYFKRKIPYWLAIDFGNAGKIPNGVWVKPFQGKCKAIDTFLYKDITLKYPLEIDGILLKENISMSKETKPVIITDFRFVKNCAKYPYKHFEINTKK